MKLIYLIHNFLLANKVNIIEKILNSFKGSEIYLIIIFRTSIEYKQFHIIPRFINSLTQPMIQYATHLIFYELFCIDKKYRIENRDSVNFILSYKSLREISDNRRMLEIITTLEKEKLKIENVLLNLIENELY